MTVTDWSYTNRKMGQTTVERWYRTTGLGSSSGSRPYAVDHTQSRSGQRDNQLRYYKEMGIPIPVHNATRSDTELVIDPPMTFWMLSKTPGYKIQGSYTVPPTADANFIDMFDEAYRVAYGKCRERYEANVSEMLAILGESRETCKSIAHAARQVGESYNEFLENDLIERLSTYRQRIQRELWNAGKVVRRKVRLIKRNPYHEVLKVVKDAWLEWSFEIMPTVHDIKSMAEGLASLQDQLRTYRRISGSYIINKTRDESFSTWADGWPWYVKVAGNTRYVQSYTLKVGGTLYKEDLGLPGFADRNGLSVRDVIPALWELMPYSWLIDYAINLGDVIDNACAGSMFLQSPYMVILRENRAIRTMRPVADTQWNISAFEEGVVTHRRFDFSRTSWSPALPSLTIRTPPGLGQMANMAAVAYEPVMKFLAGTHRKYHFS